MRACRLILVRWFFVQKTTRRIKRFKITVPLHKRPCGVVHGPLFAAACAAYFSSALVQYPLHDVSVSKSSTKQSLKHVLTFHSSRPPTASAELRALDCIARLMWISVQSSPSARCLFSCSVLHIASRSLKFSNCRFLSAVLKALASQNLAHGAGCFPSFCNSCLSMVLTFQSTRTATPPVISGR